MGKTPFNKVFHNGQDGIPLNPSSYLYTATGLITQTHLQWTYLVADPSK